MKINLYGALITILSFQSIQSAEPISISSCRSAQAKNKESGRDITGETTALVTDYAYDVKEIELKDYPLGEYCLTVLPESGQLISTALTRRNQARIWDLSMNGIFEEIDGFDQPLNRIQVFGREKKGCFFQFSQSDALGENETTISWAGNGYLQDSHSDVDRKTIPLRNASRIQCYRENHRYNGSFLKLYNWRQEPFCEIYGKCIAITDDFSERILISAKGNKKRSHFLARWHKKKEYESAKAAPLPDIKQLDKSYHIECIYRSDSEMSAVTPYDQERILVGCKYSGKIYLLEPEEKGTWKRSEVGAHENLVSLTAFRDGRFVSGSQNKLKVHNTLVPRKLIQDKVKSALSPWLKYP